MGRLRGLVAAIIGGCLLGGFLPIVGAAPAQAAEADVVAIQAGLAKLATFTSGLADTGPLGDKVPTTGLSPGQAEALGLADLFQTAIVDRLTATSPTTFDDLADIGTDGNEVDLGDGRMAVIHAIPTNAPAGSTVETVDLVLSVSRDNVDSPLIITSTTPKVDLNAPSGVAVDFQYDLRMRVNYDTARDFFWVSAGNAANPASFFVRSHAGLPPSPGMHPAVGVLQMALSGSSYNVDTEIKGTFTDPDADGKLSFVLPTSNGDVPGELASAGAPGDIVAVALQGNGNSTIAGTISLTTAPSGVPGLTMPAIDASVTVDDPDLSDDTQPVVTTTGFDSRLDNFQTIGPKDLAAGVQRLSVAVAALVGQRMGQPGQGDVDLPFMRGRLSDAIAANTLFERFLADNVKADGTLTFASVQQFLARLDATQSSGADLDVANAAWNDTTRKLSFDVLWSRATPERALPLATALPPGADDQTGKVNFGDALRPAIGLSKFNADALDDDATVDTTYRAKVTLVLDLQAPQRGQFVQTNTDGTSTVLTELPKPADRIMLRTGGSVFAADATITSPVDAARGMAGFVGVAPTGTGGLLTIEQSDAGHLVDIALKDNGDVPLPAVFDKLRTPSTFMTYATHGVARANFRLSVPGVAGFFPAGTDSVAVTLADITTPGAVAVTAVGVAARLEPLDFAGAANPNALLGKTANNLGATATALEDLGSLGAASPAGPSLTRNLQVVGQPFARFLATPELDALLTGISADPPDTMQELIDRLDDLGAASFTVDTAATPPRLILHLGYHRDVDAGRVPLGFAYDKDGARALVGSGAGGTLPVRVVSDAAVDLAIPLDTTNATGVDGVQVLPGSSVSIKPAVSVRNVNLPASAGALQLNLNGSGVEARPTLLVKGASGGPVSLKSWAAGLGATVGAAPVTCPNGETGFSVCAELPAFDSAGQPLEGDPKAFSIKLPATDPFVQGSAANTTFPAGLTKAQNETPLHLNQMSMGSGTLFDDLKAALDKASLGGKLPLVGSDLQQGANFIGSLKTNFATQLQGLPATDTGKADAVQSAIDAAVRRAAGSFPISNLTVTLVCGSGSCSGKDAKEITDTKVAFDIGQGQVDGNGCTSGCVTQANRPFNIGIPGIRLQGSSSPTATLGWKLHLAFGVSKADGFYLDTSAADEFQLGLGVKLPQKFSGTLAFLKVSVEDKRSPAPNAFAGKLAIDIDAPGGKLRLDQLANGPDLGSLFKPKLSAKVDVLWDMSSSVDGASLPGITAQLKILWNWSSADPSATSGLDLRFGNVALDLEPFFGSVLGPVVKTVQTATKPLKPAIDAVMAPLPGLSDLSRAAGGPDITLLTLMETFGTGGNPSTEGFARILRVLKTVNDFEVGNFKLPIGDVPLDGDRALAGVPTPDQALDMLKNKAVSFQKDLQDACSECAQIVNKLIGVPGAIDPVGGFQIPVVKDPSILAGLLLGKDVELASFDTGPIGRDFGFTASFGPIIPIPPIFVDISLKGSIEARFQLGFDTYGIRKAIETGKPGQLGNSLYLKDWDPVTGKEIPELSITGEAKLGVKVSLIIAEAGIRGGLNLKAIMNLHDTDSPDSPDVPNTGTGDGKVRFNELGADPEGHFDPVCIFDIEDGSALSAFIELYVKVGIGIFSKEFVHELGRGVLLDLSHTCLPKDPVLGHVTGDTLVVHVGKNGPNAGNASPPDEVVTVRSLHDPTSRAFTGFSVDFLGHQQVFGTDKYPGVNKVLVDATGYGANENINLFGDGNGINGGDGTTVPFDKEATVTGGPGNDVIKASSVAKVTANGGDGKDTIVTGAAGDVVNGGEGNDNLSTGPGDDTVNGDAGDDVIDAGLGRDVADGGADDDSINGGDDIPLGSTPQGTPAMIDPGNTLIGGPGADHIRGGGGPDRIYGDERVDLGVDDTGAAAGGNDNIDTNTGDDVVFAGAGADKVFGHSAAGKTKDEIRGNGGADQLAGGDGDDSVYGGPDPDQLLGGPGADLVHGNGADDRIGGDRSYAVPASLFNRLLIRNPTAAADGDDTLYGDAGEDDVYGGGGGDLEFGDTGHSQCAAAPAGAPEWTPPTEVADSGDGRDRVTGGAGADRLSGEGNNDSLDGGSQDDLVCGHDGDDSSVSGGDGTDTLFGGSGADGVFGDDGNDQAYGNDGPDVVNGGAGDDMIQGNGDKDTAYGEAGNDLVIGGSNTPALPDTDDALFGLGGDDYLIGDNGVRGQLYDLPAGVGVGGSDVIDGGAGDDTAFGALADDTVSGGAGADHLEGNVGADTIGGDAGIDAILGGTSPLALNGGPTAAMPDDGDTIDGGADGDSALGDNGAITTGGTRMYDVYSGGAQQGAGDVIGGGEGRDYLFGQIGADTVNGDGGNDQVEGNNGADLLDGGDGQDDVLGGTSPLALDAGRSTADVSDVGDPRVNGGPDADTVLGDNGDVSHVLDAAGNWVVARSDGSFVRKVVLLDRLSIGGGDAMAGGEGNDRLWGELGDDAMGGDGGADVMEGNVGVDSMGGGADSDDMYGGTSPFALSESDPAAAAAASDDAGDRMNGGPDDDTMLGDNGRIDRCGEGRGRDDCTWAVERWGLDRTGVAYGDPFVRQVTLLGESRTATNHDGDDLMWGENGNDLMWGENGNDVMHGNEAQDRMWGGYGADRMWGDAGVDALLGDRGLITVVALDGTNPPSRRIESKGPPNLDEDVYVTRTLWYKVSLLDAGFGGEDTMFGGQGDDSAHGGAGNDLIEGDDGMHTAGTPASIGGADKLFGDDGQDSIQGGPGHDHLFGGFGEDDLDVIRGTEAAPKIGAMRDATIAAYAADFGGSYDRDPGAEGDDIVYGGHQRDVMQADTLGDRLSDAFGNWNLFYVCPAAYGGSQITRAVSPGLVSFFEQLKEADGAIGDTAAAEVSIVYAGEANEGNAGSAYPNTPGHFTCGAP